MHVNDVDTIKDAELYDRLLNEFPKWIEKARQKRVIYSSIHSLRINNAGVGGSSPPIATNKTGSYGNRRNAGFLLGDAGATLGRDFRGLAPIAGTRVDQPRHAGVCAFPLLVFGSVKATH